MPKKTKTEETPVVAEVAVAEEPKVTLTCELCGKVAIMPAGTDVTNPGLALKSSGFDLPILGKCKQATSAKDADATKCLINQARAAT